MSYGGRPSRGYSSGLSPGTINGNVTVTGTLGAGNTQITGTLGATGAVDFDTSLNVDGAIHADGAIDTDSTLKVDLTASVPDETFLPPFHRFVADTGYTPTWYSRCNETADKIKDEVGNANLTAGAGGGQLYQYNVSGVRHGATVKNRGLFQSTNSVTGGWGANVSDLVDGDWLIGCYFAATATDAGNRPLFGRVDTTDQVPCAYCHIDATGGSNPSKPEFQLKDGVLTLAPALDKVVTDGVPRLMMWRRAGVNLDGYIRGNGEVAVTVNQDVTGLATLTGGATPVLFVANYTGVQYGLNLWVGGLFIMVGAGATSASFTTIDTALGIG